MANNYTQASFAFATTPHLAFEYALDVAILNVLHQSDVVGNGEGVAARLREVVADEDGYGRLHIDVSIELAALLGKKPELTRPYAEARISAIADDAFSEMWTTNEVQVEINDDANKARVFVYHDETFDVDVAVQLLQRHLTREDTGGIIAFTAAWTCDKPRTDQFGGGAYAVTANDLRFMTTGEAEAKLVAELQAEQKRNAADPGAVCPSCGARGGVRADVESAAYYYLPSTGDTDYTEPADVLTYDARGYECTACGKPLDIDDIKKSNPGLEV